MSLERVISARRNLLNCGGRARSKCIRQVVSFVCVAFLESIRYNAINMICKYSKFYQKIIPVLVFLCLQNISALDIELTGKEAAAYASAGYNRGFSGFGEAAFSGGVELNGQYAFGGGFSFEFAAGITDIKLAAGARVEPIKSVPFYITLAYMYNGLPQYNAHSQTILPLFAFNADRAGIAIGPGLRFTSYFKDKAVFDSMFNFSAYINFLIKEKLRMGICFANIDEWSVKNMGFYSLAVKSTWKINENWSLINDIILLQSGSVALSANFYGIAWRGGAKFTW